MEKITFIDRGYEEVIVIDGKEIRIDRFSTMRLIGLLKRYNVLDVEMIGYNEASEKGL